MEWEGEALPLLKAVASALEESNGEAVRAGSVNAQLSDPLDEIRLDRRLGELLKSGFIEGPTIDDCAAPTHISLTARGRGVVYGWPSEGSGGRVSISDSRIENVAGRDINISTMNVANFFEAWEHQIEELDAPPDEKKQAREKVRMAKDIVTGAAGSAGGRWIYEAFPLLFG